MAEKVKYSKFRELVLYLARETESDPKCGKTKLYKILFYSDFWAFQKLGQSISGQTYQKLKNGPAPKQAYPLIKAMIAAHLCAWAVRDYFGRIQQKLVALQEPKLAEFSGEEIAIVQDVIRMLRNYDASGVSELSHRFMGWQLAEEGEVIPYSTVSLGAPRPPTMEEVEYGRRLAQELGE
jgi:uncharacterized phage-associated protein